MGQQGKRVVGFVGPVRGAGPSVVPQGRRGAQGRGKGPAEDGKDPPQSQQGNQGPTVPSAGNGPTCGDQGGKAQDVGEIDLELPGGGVDQEEGPGQQAQDQPPARVAVVPAPQRKPQPRRQQDEMKPVERLVRHHLQIEERIEPDLPVEGSLKSGPDPLIQDGRQVPDAQIGEQGQEQCGAGHQGVAGLTAGPPAAGGPRPQDHQDLQDPQNHQGEVWRGSQGQQRPSQSQVAERRGQPRSHQTRNRPGLPGSRQRGFKGCPHEQEGHGQDPLGDELGLGHGPQSQDHAEPEGGSPPAQEVAGHQHGRGQHRQGVAADLQGIILGDAGEERKGEEVEAGQEPRPLPVQPPSQVEQGSGVDGQP